MSTNPAGLSPGFLKGGGEMGQRIREFNWAPTPVGPTDGWPQSLRTSVSTILHSKFPMFIWWGEDLIQFYNDAYRPSLGNEGKHPSALGQRGEDCWPEIWPVIYPLIRQVMDEGEATWSEDQLIPIYRNGRLEDVYWTFSYSPLIDESGHVGGVLVVCNENTDKVLHRQAEEKARLGIIRDIMEQKQFSELLTQEVAERTLELQRSNDDLLQFAHVITHDLKEPIRKIKVFCNRIKEEMDEILPEKAHLYLQKIQNASDRMFSMIEGVLNYSVVNFSDEEVESIDLNKTIRSILVDLEVVIREKSARINYAELPVIQGASILIYQLFYNLLNNSLKFSKKDVSPDIVLSSSLIPEGGVELVQIRVSDNGIGFDQLYAETIFNTFTRLNSKDKFEGTGLGLALCKKIAERHGGYITAVGLPNEGATILVSLPVRSERKKIL